jgi:hypothetical protein
MFLYNAYKDQYGVGREPRPKLSKKQNEAASEHALQKARAAVLWMHIHDKAPRDVYTSLELAALSWTETIVRSPHEAQSLEKRLRQELREENQREIEAGLRLLDSTPQIGKDAAMERLVNHQIAELAMMIGHMDGLGRALTILRLEAESAVQMVEGTYQKSGGIKPSLDKEGCVQFTGYFNNRPDLHSVLQFVGLDQTVLTINELMVNPQLAKQVQERLDDGEDDISYDSEEAAQTAEY